MKTPGGRQSAGNPNVHENQSAALSRAALGVFYAGRQICQLQDAFTLQPLTGRRFLDGRRTPEAPRSPGRLLATPAGNRPYPPMPDPPMRACARQRLNAAMPPARDNDCHATMTVTRQYGRDFGRIRVIQRQPPWRDRATVKSLKKSDHGLVFIMFLGKTVGSGLLRLKPRPAILYGPGHIPRHIVAPLP